MALQSAGATGGTPGSPTPAGGAWLSTIADVRLRRDVGAGDQIVGKVALLDLAPLDADVAVEGVAETHDDGAFHLRAHPVGIDDEAAVHGHVDARDADLALIVDSDLEDDRDIGQEAPVDGDAAPVPRRQLAAPAAGLGGDVEHRAHAAGVDRILVDRRAIVRIIHADRREVDFARSAEEPAQILPPDRRRPPQPVRRRMSTPRRRAECCRPNDTSRCGRDWRPGHSHIARWRCRTAYRSGLAAIPRRCRRSRPAETSIQSPGRPSDEAMRSSRRRRPIPLPDAGRRWRDSSRA